MGCGETSPGPGSALQGSFLPGIQPTAARDPEPGPPPTRSPHLILSTSLTLSLQNPYSLGLLTRLPGNRESRLSSNRVGVGGGAEQPLRRGVGR